jgi:Ca-activated chloride channel family protein
MRRSLLAVLVLLPAASTLAPAAPAASPAFPRGEAVYRPECFGYVQELSSGAGYGAGYGAPATTTPTAPPPPPSAAPPSHRGGNGISVGGVFGSKKQAPSSAPSPTPPPAAPAAPAADAWDDELGDSDMQLESVATKNGPKRDHASGKVTKDAKGRYDMAEPEPMEEAKEGASKQKAAEKPEEDEEELGNVGATDEAERQQNKRFEPEVKREVTQAPPKPVLDWGSTVYLSNDDSMSLASAQRLLYATMHELPFSVREVRPHELLNYFSFDHVTPDRDQLFDVLASAEQDGDQLSVALAVKGALPPRQALDLTLVVDRSCSMMDEGRMDYTKRGLTLMSDQLTRGDRLDVVLFDDRVCVPLENYVVGRDDPQMLANVIRMMQPEGATDVGLGLRTAYGVAKTHEDTHGRNRRVMLVTDALMNTGDVDPNTVSEIGRAFDQDGIRLTGVGVGREFNDQALDMLTEKGKGAYVFLGSEAVVDRVFGAAGFSQLVQTIAHDVHFALKLPASLAMERFYGEEVSTVKEEVQPVNYYAGTTQLFLQDLVLKGGKVVGSDPVELEITYRDAVTGEPSKRLFRTTVGAMVEAEPHNVRKGLALMAWTDMLTAQAMGADPCGDELQRYASRAGKVADDAEIAFVNGLVRRRCGEFELPSFVSNQGVPFKVRVDADMPISTVALTCRGERRAETLTGSDAIAMFTVAPGVCSLTLSGTLDMTAQVEVPQTGGDLRCIVRGGRIACS